MSCFKFPPLVVRTAVFFALCAAFFVSISASFVHAADFNFFKSGIEERIEKALPGSRVSIARINMMSGKGIAIEGFTLSVEEKEIVRAKKILFGYGFFVSSMLSWNFLSASEVEIEGLEVASSNLREVFRPSHPYGSDKENNSVDREEIIKPGSKTPKIRIRNSVFNFQGERIEVRESDISFAHAENAGEFLITLKNGHISVTSWDASIKDLSLNLQLLTIGGFRVGSVSGKGAVKTPGKETRAEFEVTIPEEDPGAVWKARLFFQEINFLNRKGVFSFDSIVFSKDGTFSVAGNLSLGSLSSRVRAKFNTVGGQWIPNLGEGTDFEIESEVFKEEYSLGVLKVGGFIEKKDGQVVVSGGLSKDYLSKSDLFQYYGRPEKFDFQFSLNGYRVSSGNLSVRSPQFSIKADIQTLNGGRSEINYGIETEDIFYFSNLARALRDYGMSGFFKSSGRIQSRGDGKTFLSGKAEVEDFAATFRKRVHMGKGEMNFNIPIAKFPLGEIFVKFSAKDFSYGEILAKKLNFKLENQNTHAEFQFANNRSLEFVARIRRENGNIYADIKEAALKANSLDMFLANEFVMSASKERVEIGDVALYGKKSSFGFTGFYNIGKQQSKVNLVADFSNLSTELFEYFHPPLEKHRGVLSGQVILDGRAVHPVVNAKIEYRSATDATRADFSVVRADIFKRFVVGLSVDNTESGSFLKLDGEFSLRDKQSFEIQHFTDNILSYSLIMKANRFSIQPIGFLSQKIQNLDGIFSGELAVDSQNGDIDTNGHIDIDSARVKIGEWTELIAINSAQMEFKKDKIFSSLSLSDFAGTGEVEGTFNLSDLSYRCEAELQGIRLHIKHLHSDFYGMLFIDGSGRNIRIRGKELKTKNANIWIRKKYNIAVSGLVFVDSVNGRNFAEGKELGFFSQTSDLDLNLLISEDTKINLDKVNSFLKGGLSILRKPGDNFSIVNGKLNLLRGSYSILGKQFAIDKGSISVSTREHLSPRVNVNALYEKAGFSVKANLYGETDNLRLRLSSVPAMKEDEIILALLAHNREEDDRAIDAIKKVRDKQAGGYLAFDYAADELFSSILDGNSLFNFVDVLSITRENSGILESEVEVGTYITNRLYFAYERDNETLPLSTSYKSKFTAQYSLSDRFIFEGVAGGITPGGNLLFNYDFR